MTEFTTGIFPRPLYMQVHDIIIHKITSGEWKPGVMIPNESDLAKQLGTSTGTIRKALNIIERQRIITRRQGRGTFVNDFAVPSTALHFSAIFDQQGDRIPGEKRGQSVSRTAATADEVSRLGLRAGDELIRVTRKRTHLRRTFMIEECALPSKYYSKLPDELSTYQISALAQQNAILPSFAEEKVSVMSASQADADDFGIANGAPLLTLDRVVFSEHREAIERRVARCHLHDLEYIVFHN